MKSITLQITRPPYSGTRVLEALDAAMVAAVFDFQTSVLFRGEGVYCLLADQNADNLPNKTLARVLSAMPAYDINQIYVCEHSLQQFGLEVDQLIDGVSLISTDAIGTLLNNQDAVLGV